MSTPEAGKDWSALFARVERQFEVAAQKMSTAEAETVYSLGYHLLQQGRADRAARILALLTLVRPRESKYWHALGMSCRHLNNHAGAVEALTCAVELDPQSFGPGFLLVESLLLLGRRPDATGLLEQLAAAAQEHSDVTAMSRAEGLRALIQLPLQ